MPDVRHSPDYLRQLLADLEEFRHAYDGVLQLCVPTGVARGLAPAIIPKEGIDPEVLDAATARVHYSSGKIAELASLTGAKLVVEGAPAPIDPFVNALAALDPKPIVEPRNVIQMIHFARGRIEGMLQRADATLTRPEAQREELHPTVWGAAGRLWRDGYLRRAVAAAAEAVTLMMKNRTGRNDKAETDLWRQAFIEGDPKPGEPRLRWPGNPRDRDVSTMQAGLMAFAPGVNMVIRNPATHRDEDPSEQVALEQLCVLSVLARLVDQCRLEEVPAPATPKEP